MDPHDESFKEEVRTDMWQERWWAVGAARGETVRLMPTIQEILAEANQLRSLNPSASIVWAVQALEIFFRNGLLKPYLQFRLGYETELADEISEKLFGRNGAKVAKQWLNDIFPIKFADRLLESGQASIWNNLWAGNDTIIDWRDRIVHRAYVATSEEAARAIELVDQFISGLAEIMTSEAP